MNHLSESWPYDFVEVRWDDAETDHGWENESEIKTNGDLVTTFGLLVKKTRKHVVVAGSAYWNENDEQYSFNARTTIPRAMVKTIWVLIPKNTDPPVQAIDSIIGPGGTA